ADGWLCTLSVASLPAARLLCLQSVVELGRKLRDRNTKPVKLPLSKLVVVHPDAQFLADVQGVLHEYVVGELNVRQLEVCADPLKYATLRAEPDLQLLGKRLGRALKDVSAAVKALDSQQVLDLQAAGFVEVAGHRLELSDLKIKRDWRLPEGVEAGSVDADSDGDVLVVLDLTVDAGLISAGAARELVNRYQKLRKKAGVTPMDPVEFYYGASPPAACTTSANGAETTASQDAVASLIAEHRAYLASALGGPLRPLSRKPAGAVVLETEYVSIGSTGSGTGSLEFVAVLTTPGVVVDCVAVQQLVAGDVEQAAAVDTYLQSRSQSKLQAQLAVNGGVVEVHLNGRALKLVAEGLAVCMDKGKDM
ncbi:uncharacterized protein HaLaN_08870, partial [Haematococcus lacustris]